MITLTSNFLQKFLSYRHFATINAYQTVQAKPFTDSHENDFVELLKFLLVASQFEESVSPSVPIDLVWHEFCRFPDTYYTFCQDYFGRSLTHNGNLALRIPNRPSYEYAKRSAQEIFSNFHPIIDKRMWTNEIANCGTE